MRLLLALLLAAGLAVAQGANRRRPYIGYLCAAGGQQGQVVRITAGGQNLRGARRVIVSGAGVTGKVLKHQRTPWLLKPDDRRVVAQQLRRMANRRGSGEEPPKLPDHPMLKHLDVLTPKELRRVAYEFLDPARRAQLSAQIAETVEIEITVDADATPGDRELRLQTPAGLTNPVLFQVGTLPEHLEREPNDYRTVVQPPVDTPCVFNGQVSFKDVDRFRFRAKRGEKLVIEAQARRLVPYLADAVPGWFQATLTLYDGKGQEIRFVDDHWFDPDPVLYFVVPQDGYYVIEIRDAIHRGRADFVYRITVAERPYVTGVFPLGAQAGTDTIARLDGWNLLARQVRFDTAPGAAVRRAVWARGELETNPVTYAVGELPECREGAARSSLALPVVVNGRLGKPGETDRFRFEGRAGQEVVAEVTARRLGSPVDSVLTLTDAAGKVVAWNDDHADKAAGLVTHQADSYVRAVLPADGTYTVTVGDAQGHGGPAFAYRLRLSEPRPDFTVLVTPASVNVPGGGLALVTVHAVRRDGFDGPIELTLRDPPEGMALGGRWIPAGCEKIRMTLAAPPRKRGRADTATLRIEAHALLEAGTITRPAVPAEDMMQAFGLRHLVPARELMVGATRSWQRTPPLRLEDDRPARIPAGGTTEVRIVAPAPRPAANTKVWFELDTPPKGVTLKGTRREARALVLVLAAEKGKAQVGAAGNLIVEAHAEVAVPQRGGAKGKTKRAPRKRTVTVLLPAVPFVVVE